MRFSLILSTINRTTEVKSFLESLVNQIYHDFEVIVVDQNQDKRLENLLELFSLQLKIIHLHSSPGLSLARNIGVKHVTGDIIAFPDDDCLYPEDLLKNVSEFLAVNTDYQGLIGRPIDDQGNTSVGRFEDIPGYLNKNNIWRRASSITLFLKKEIILKIGFFDEKFGLGAKTIWGAGEDIDYPLRALENGYKIYYDPSFTVVHPQVVVNYTDVEIKRAFLYGGGMGGVLKKHKYSLKTVLYLLIRPFGGTIISLVLGELPKARFHWAIFSGRLRGWRLY